MKNLEQECQVEFSVSEPTKVSRVFVTIYPYWYKLVTLGERVKMYFWRKQRNRKQMTAIYDEEDFA